MYLAKGHIFFLEHYNFRKLFADVEMHIFIITSRHINIQNRELIAFQREPRLCLNEINTQ